MPYVDKNILYENGRYWVLRTTKGFEIYRTGPTASTRCGIVGNGPAPQLGLARAIAECDKRANNENSP